ncbi:NAD(P)-dependent oxidoreductase [Alkalihalobacillus hwajinpoensis]|uniref:NAD(P)-dependent oxidoreductase n=1 Tax=Guptibacillus hwajinpoensis TaxID=208199 RepID=UPI00188385FC|nr:NAD(P)-dependent oxidoreductase [Pseudalkalibacillus hwajinpoensis]MBF0705410.1 NAD(P)-dependent oxidoreductase [Pseudalkalibacillus hwajinpoensis]
MEHARVGVIGTGLIGTGLIRLLSRQKDVSVSNILTRRNTAEMVGYPLHDRLTNSVDELIQTSDLIVECSGDVIYGSEIIEKAMEAGLPIVTMNAELHVTTGSYFARKGFITEAEGDQPGCLAALNENIRQMGFKPVVYGNIKGFLNTNPSKEDMEFWSKRNGTTLGMTTSFTDGTKVQIEQALVANGLGGTIARNGLLGFASDDANDGGEQLARVAESTNMPISDYILSSKLPPGVFITATHDEGQQDTLRYYKMGMGPYYTLMTNYHLCHLEILKTIRRVLDGKGVLLNNSEHPKVSVAAIAKKKLDANQFIEQGIGSFDVRGEAVLIEGNENHIPIGVLRNARLKRPIEEGEMIQFSDVEIPESIALKAWNSILKKQITLK